MGAGPEDVTPSATARAAAWLLYDLPVGVASALIVVMLLVGNANTLLRWVTGQQINGSSELLVILLPVTVFLALPAAERAGANVRSTALTDRLPPRAGRAVSALGLLVTGGMTGLLFAASASKALAATTDREALVGVRTLPVWPSRIAIALGFGLLVLVLVGQFARLVRGEEPLPESGEPSHVEL